MKNTATTPKGNSARHAGYLFLISSVLFILAMVVVQLAFPCNAHGCYNLGTNPISDLGNTVLSVLWPVFNYSIILFGALLFGGLVLLLESFPKDWIGKLGILFLMLSAFGAAGVGTVPENTTLAIHSTFAAISFVAGGAGVLLIGIALLRRRGIGWYSGYSILSGAITLIVFFAFTLPLGIFPSLAYYGPGLGFGFVERIIAFPVILWVFVTGILLSKKNSV